MAFDTNFGSLFTSVCRWLSANWKLNPALPTAVAPSAEALDLAASPAAGADFALASRLAAVARHNVPSSRPARQVKACRHPVPAAKLIAAKSYKDTRLPTAFAVSTLSKPARASADIIALDTARRHSAHRNHRIAA